MVDFAIGLWAKPEWSAGDIPAVLEFVRIAEESGIDCFDAGDHLALSPTGIANYPHAGGRITNPDYPFFEPLIMLAGIATVTKRMRLATTILLAPLRPALLLAKQAATLDVLSGGRLDLGVGAGWQKEEFDAVGAPWENRFGYLDEQIKVCRALWSKAPASFHGRFVNFDDLHSKPFPRQPGGVPIWFGVSPTERNFRRIAELGDGWLPMETDPELLGRQIAQMRATVAAHGRDPSSIKIRGRPPIVRNSNGDGDLDATLALVPAFIEAGCDTIVFSPYAYCHGEDDFARVIQRIVAAK
jgi:probable F420-dependent oxidoreductase